MCIRDSPEAAYPFALQAAASARESFSLGAVVQLLQIAMRGMPANDPAQHHRVTAALAEALMLDGQYDDSDHWFETAAQSADSVNSRAKIDMQRGELALRRGDKAEAVRLFESSLKQLGTALPSSFGLYARLAKELSVQFLHTLMPGFLAVSYTHLTLPTTPYV